MGSTPCAATCGRWTSRTAEPRPRPAAESTPQARHVNKETQQMQILHHERQRAEKQPFFRFLPARRMGEAGKEQRFPKENF